VFSAKRGFSRSVAMPIYLKDVVKDPGILMRSVREQKCFHCQVPLQETLTGKRKTSDGFVCSDCYYDELGAEIERRPLGSAGVRRG
jgi:hypothetical protein